MTIFTRIEAIIASKIRHVFEQKFNKTIYTKSEEESNNWSKFSKENNKTTQFDQDLNLFDLKPSFKLIDLKKKRLEILKKYHPDLYFGNKRKEKIALEMIQIYNEAYERLNNKAN